MRMIASIRRRRDKDLSVLLQILKVAARVSGAAPVPYLEGIFDLAIHIIELAQEVHGAKVECIKLARRAGELALAIRNEMRQTEQEWPNCQSKLQNILDALTDIDTFMRNQASRKWLDRFKNQDEIRNKVEEYNSRLQDSITSFGIISLLSIENRLIEMSRVFEGLLTTQGLSTRSHEQDLVSLRQQPARGTDRYDGMKVYWKDEIFLQRPLRPALGASLIPEDYEAQVNGQLAVVRHYRDDNSRFQRDLACLRCLWHPNVQQLMGVSQPQSDHNFLVVRSGTQDALTYSKTASGIQRLLLLTDMMLQFHSAVEYLTKETGWDAWMTESDILVDQMGHVFLDPSELERTYMANSTRLSFVRKLLRDDWSYGALTLYEADPTDAWREFAASLHAYALDKALPHKYQNLFWSLARILSPPSMLWLNPRHLKLGDVGLETASGQMTIITNMCDAWPASVVEVTAAEEMVLGEDGLHDSMCQGQQTRHTFYVRPGHKGLKFECRVHALLMDRQAGWYALAQNALRLAEENQVVPQDLLLVTQSYNTYTAEYWFDEQGILPSKVYFFEGPLDGNQRWGYWSLDADDWENVDRTGEARHHPPYAEFVVCKDRGTGMQSRLRWRCWADYVKLTEDLCLVLQEVEVRVGHLPEFPTPLRQGMGENVPNRRLTREYRSLLQ